MFPLNIRAMRKKREEKGGKKYLKPQRDNCFDSSTMKKLKMSAARFKFKVHN